MQKGINYIADEFDYFKQPVQLIFNNKRTISTRFGKILSFLIYGVSIALIFSLGHDIYYRVNPITTQISKIDHTAPIVNLTERKIVLMSQFTDRNFMKMDDLSYFTVDITQFKVERDNGTAIINYYPVKRTECENYKEHFKNNNFSEQYDSNNLGVGFCFDIFNQSVSIGGAFTSDYFSNINYKLKKCVNSTASEVICKPQEEIEDKLKNGYFEITYIDNYIDTDNFYYPAVQHFSNYFIKTDPRMFKFVDVYFKMAYIFTDSGLIFEDKRDTSVIMYDYVREQVSFADDNLLIDFYFNISSNVLKVNRIYMKLQTLAATVGGIFKVFIVVGYILSNIFTQFKFYEYLINFLFESEEHEPPRVNSAAFLKTHLNRNQAGNEISFSINIKSDKSILNSRKELTENSSAYLLKNKQKPISKNIDLGFVETLKIKLFCLCSDEARKKRRIYQNSYENLLKYIDFIRITLVMQEFKQFKKIIFDEKQKLMFNYLKKPKLMNFEENKREKNISILLFREEVIKSYKSVYERRNSLDVNKRLIENMREDLKDKLDFFMK